jgi:hypothetical protein
MDATLKRIEALPGEGRYAVTFRRPDGSEQTAVVHAVGEGVEVAEAALPAGWSAGAEPFLSTARAVQAFDTARRQGGVRSLRDVNGGWDVSLGNIVLGDDGVPDCTAHGPLVEEGGTWVCTECGARAQLG